MIEGMNNYFRKPMPLHPVQNLMLTFDDEGWTFIGLSFVACTIVFMISVRLGSHNNNKDPSFGKTLFIPIGKYHGTFFNLLIKIVLRI